MSDDLDEYMDTQDDWDWDRCEECGVAFDIDALEQCSCGMWVCPDCAAKHEV